MHAYEIRPRKDKRGVDLISDALPSGRLWYFEPNAVAHAISYAKSRSRSHSAMIRVYDEAGNEELFIDGKVQGHISSDGVLTIGENADIHGEIKTKSVTVYGKVHGNIMAERCELKSKCTLKGDLKAARLIIEEGAAFIGRSQNTLASTVESPDFAWDGESSGSSKRKQ